MKKNFYASFFGHFPEKSECSGFGELVYFGLFPEIQSFHFTVFEAERCMF